MLRYCITLFPISRIRASISQKIRAAVDAVTDLEVAVCAVKSQELGERLNTSFSAVR